MINLRLLREDPEKIIALLKKKEPSFDAQLLYEKDKEIRNVRSEIETLQYKKNELAERGKNGITLSLREESKKVGKVLKKMYQLLEKIESIFQELYLSCPNIPDKDIPQGGKEYNEEIRHYGEKPSFNFSIKNHIELGRSLGWLDFEAAATIAGSNFALYKGEGVRLVYALAMMMLNHNQKHGFSMVLPPYFANEQSLYTTGNFPKFKDQVYCVSKDNLYLIPTAEVSLANLYRDHIFSQEDLPVRLTAWTSCFRKEAGSYGATERGLIRIHQFEKVEIFSFCTPQQAKNELDRMITCAEELLKMLGLTYRVVLLAAEDCSFSSARTYDLEVWMPAQKSFYEVSSISNCTDFQARRGKIRYQKVDHKKTEYVFTLNASSLALPRLIVALMETYQQKNGAIIFPDVLKHYGM